MGVELSLILFLIVFCLVVLAYFLGYGIKKGASYIWHATGEKLNIRIPRWRAH